MNANLQHSAPRPVDMLELLPRYSRAAGLERVKWIASSNESPIPPSPKVQEAIAKAAASGNRYPSLFGGPLASAIAERAGVRDDQVVVGAGSLSLLQQALLAYTGPGSEVVFAWRSYEAYPMLATLVGADSVQVPLGRDHRHDGPAMVSAIGSACRAVIVCNPNNPTGTFLAPAEVEAILRAVPPRVLVILDEAYREFAGSDFDAVSLLRERPNLAILRTFSKAYGLAGLRAGYLIANRDVAQAIQRTSPPFALSATALVAALAAWADEEYTRQVVERASTDRDSLQASLRGLGVVTPPSASNFVWVPAPQTAPRLEELCIEHGVAVRAFEGFGVRITTGQPEASAAFVRAVADLLKERSGPLDL